MLLTFPYIEVSREICLEVSGDNISISVLSLKIRQLLEHTFIVKEINDIDVDWMSVGLASIVAHNRHIGANKLKVTDKMIQNNPGLLKALPYKNSVRDLVKDNNYELLCNYLSGHVHSPSTFEQLVPMQENKYTNELLLKTMFLVIVNMFEIFNSLFLNNNG